MKGHERIDRIGEPDFDCGTENTLSLQQRNYRRSIRVPFCLRVEALGANCTIALY